MNTSRDEGRGEGGVGESQKARQNTWVEAESNHWKTDSDHWWSSFKSQSDSDHRETDSNNWELIQITEIDLNQDVVKSLRLIQIPEIESFKSQGDSNHWNWFK